MSYFRSRSLALKARLALLAALAVAVALGLAACGGSSGGGSTAEGGEGGTLKATIASFPDYLDPGLGLSVESLNSFYNTYIPLLTYAHADGKAGGRVVPGLAKTMPKVSDGGRTYELQLQSGLRYSNGEPVKASDFRAAIERVFRLNSPGSPFYEDIVGAARFAKTKEGGIAGIEADDRTGAITIHLVKPRGTFENELALPTAAPLPAQTPAEDLTTHPPPATGPYVITKSQPGRGWELERNQQWAKTNAKLVPDVPSGHVDKIEFKVLRNQSTQVSDVESGRFDWMFNAPPAERYAAVKEKFEGTQFKVNPAPGTYFFWLNTTQAPFNDVAVRRAVQYAVDARALERIYAGQLLGTQQVLPPGMPGYEQLALYPHSLAKAKEMIAAANPSDRSITVWGDNESPNNEAVEYYGGVLEELGFEVKLKIINSDNYFPVIGNDSTPDLDTGFANWFAEYPNPNAFFEPMLTEGALAPTNATNLARFADPKISAKIERLATEPLGPQQEREYTEVDREVMEEAPLVPYGNATAPTFVSSAIDLEKVLFNPTFSQDLTSFQFK
ncbi:MAG: ABC transporter substrate-binding protein [Actinobacteria bacterium]|nr:ABC transporter substrate-binding protein [Actinomycetota bacterium]